MTALIDEINRMLSEDPEYVAWIIFVSGLNLETPVEEMESVK